MPEKQLDKQIVILIAVMSLVGALANSLSDEELTKKNLKHFLIQLTVGGCSGVIFGMLSCWLIGENIWAIGGVSGVGSVCGINGVRWFSGLLKKVLEYKICGNLKTSEVIKHEETNEEKEADEDSAATTGITIRGEQICRPSRKK